MILMEWIRPSRTVEAHCDLPCGIYDPEQARIEAESCFKIAEKYAVLDRTRAVDGYVSANTRLIHAECDTLTQRGRGYA